MDTKKGPEGPFLHNYLFSLASPTGFEPVSPA